MPRVVVCWGGPGWGQSGDGEGTQNARGPWRWLYVRPFLVGFAALTHRRCYKHYCLRCP